MPLYSIQGEGVQRVLVVAKAAAHRFRFTNDKREPVRLRIAGSKLVAVVSGAVVVYAKPTANEFHRELMQHNARAMWCGLQSDPDRLVDNMLEYVETI